MTRAPAPPTRRVNRGRGHSYLIDGEAVDGVTTIIGDGIPKPALIDWAARTTAGYALDNWEDLGKLSASERLRTLERARWQSTSEKAARGTTVHDLAMKLAAGQEVEVPENAAGMVDAYLRFVAEWQPEEILVEVPVFNRTLRYGGTLDLVAELADGWTWLLDYKTGGKGIFREVAIQLAAYRNAEFYIDADGREQPMPQIDFCGAVWLREDGYDLYPVTADDRAFRIFQYARAVAGFANAPKDDFVAEAEPAPELAA